uniref:Ubiquitin-like protease family profile domain-containing protein n=1 Tax=Solanum lycopersicum TaxID=4081 RepID=A0A3Q7EEV4_SOLLC
MSREVEGSSKQALLIKVNGVILKFTIRTFALITGLNCVGVVEDFKFNTEEPNRLIVQYFCGDETIRRSDLFDRFNDKVWVDNDDDAIKFAILYFIHMFVYSGEKRSLRIPRIHFDLVESGRICGMPVVLQIWIYECMGKRQTNFARKISDRIPRILNWQTVGAQPRFKTLMKNTFNDGNREIKWKNVVPSLMEIAVLQLPPEGLHKSTEGVQTEPHRDIDEQVLSGQNSDDDFVDPPPPSMKVTGKRKKGQSVSPAKTVRKNDSNMTDQMEQTEKIDPVANQNVEKDSQIPSISVSHEQLMRNELSELRKEVREEFKDIRKLINDNFNIIMSILKDQKNNDNAGQGSQPFTSPILSENQNQDNTNNHNAAQGRQHFTKSVDSENQNQKSEGHESSNNGSEEVFQGDISDVADNQVDCDNSPVRNLITVDAGFSSSKSIIPSPSFVRPLVFESQHDFTHQHDNDEEDQFIFPTPIQSIVPLEGAAGHDAAIRNEVTKLAQLIPLKLTMYDYYKNRGLDRSVSQEENELFEIVFIDNIPQQTGGSLDCGIYMLAFAEWLSYGQGNSSGAFDIMFLRARYATLLWNYAKQKQDNGAISDYEAPPRHAMPQSVRVVSDPIEIQ